MTLEAQEIAHRGDDHMLHIGFRQRLLHHMGEVFQNEQRFRTGILQLVFEFTRGVERIDIHDRQAGAQDRVGRNRVLQNIRHHHRDAVTLLQTDALQPAANGARLFFKFAIGDGLSHAGKSLAIGKLLAASFQEFGKRGVAEIGQFHRYALRIRCKPWPLHGTRLLTNRTCIAHCFPPTLLLATVLGILIHLKGPHPSDCLPSSATRVDDAPEVIHSLQRN